MFTYFTFLYCYGVLSCIGLIKDLFFTQYNVVCCDPQVVVNNYKEVSHRNLNVIIYGLCPFFVFHDIVYYLSDEYNYFMGFIQTGFTFYCGYVLHRLFYIYLCSQNFEFDRYNIDNSLNFIFRMCNRDYLEIFALYLIPMYLPLIIIGANRFAYDCIFVIFMIYASIYYSNNEKLLIYLNEFITEIKLQTIDVRINKLLDFLKYEYYKFMKVDQNNEIDNEEETSNDEEISNDEETSNNDEETSNNDEETSEDSEKVEDNQIFNKKLEDSLNNENKKDL